MSTNIYIPICPLPYDCDFLTICIRYFERVLILNKTSLLCKAELGYLWISSRICILRFQTQFQNMCHELGNRYYITSVFFRVVCFVEKTCIVKLYKRYLNMNVITSVVSNNKRKTLLNICLKKFKYVFSASSLL